jgi:hypothetical protein
MGPLYWSRIFLKKQELRKAKSEGTKTVINIGSPVCFQEFFRIPKNVNTQANYTLQSQKNRMAFASMRNCGEVGHNRVLWQTSILCILHVGPMKFELVWTFHTGFRVPKKETHGFTAMQKYRLPIQKIRQLSSAVATLRCENARQRKLLVVLERWSKHSCERDVTYVRSGASRVYQCQIYR